MGFLSELGATIFDSMVNTGGDLLRKKYEEMPIKQLKQEWKSVFGSHNPRNGIFFDDRSPNAILDEVYGQRVDYRNFRYKVQKYERGW